jgi:16S rRNA (guanine(966)-N(2))-methyltransferase RsmD
MALRPTAMKVKEALFDVLENRVKGASLVDFFAGTGNVGIEALSRGADHVVFVEHHPPSVRLLRNNLTACGFHSKAKIYTMDATAFLRRFKKTPETFDILFADPPYHGPLAERFLRHLGRSDMITERTLVVIEHFHKLLLPERTGCLRLVKRYRYGDTLLSIYRYSVQAGPTKELDEAEKT